MIVQLTVFAAILQDLFTSTADFLAQWTGFIKRPNILTGSAVAQTLVFRWLADPKDTLENMAEALGISPQALQQHCPQAVPFFRALIETALRRLHECQAQARPLGLLDAFGDVIIDDATSISLPADLAALFPGCGGNTAGAGAATVKLLLRYELKSGRILALTFHPGRGNEVSLAAHAHQLTPNSLYLADMGFFDAARLRGFAAAERYWITRVPAATRVCVGGIWCSLWDWLRGATEDLLDVPEGQLTESEGQPCRLVALRCPEEVTNRRRQKLRERTRKAKGQEPSARSLALCAWTVLATNVPVRVLAARSVWIVYRCRWQIELLFKRAKQQCGWEFSHGREGYRVLVEVLAKILGFIVAHWATLLRAGPLAGVSAKKLLAKVVEYARQIRASLTKGLERIVEVLQELAGELQARRGQRPRKNKPSTRDLLFNPELAA